MFQANDAPVESISLRGGASFDIWPDRIVAGGHVYPFAELRGAALAPDPSSIRGAPTVPAISLRAGDGAWQIYVPADPPDAQRALTRIYEKRPDLRASAARPVVRGSGASALASRDQTALAGIAHLSFFFAPFLLPLIIWVATLSSAPYASRQAKQAFFFHLGSGILSVIIVAVAALVFAASLAGSAASGDGRAALPGVALMVVGILVVGALALTAMGFSIYAAVETFQGHDYSYPFLKRL